MNDDDYTPADLLRANSMAEEGEKETDFNDRKPSWALLPHLKLPPPTPDYKWKPHPIRNWLARQSADYSEENEKLLKKKQQEEQEEEEKKRKEKAQMASKEELDWDLFDFSSSSLNENDSNDEEEEYEFNGADDEEEQMKLSAFFGGTDELKPKTEEEELEENAQKADEYMTDYPLGREWSRELIRNRKFKTPPSWLRNPEFENHVPYEIWGKKHNPKYFEEHNDLIWDSDKYTRLAGEYVSKITDYYLTSHRKVLDKIGTARSEKRYFTELLATNNATLKYPVMQSIPSALTPDKELGVEYTNEVIEMKNKIMLKPKLPSAKEAWGNEEFGYNDELEPVSLVGTVREQYNWLPDPKYLPYKIENHKLSKLKPILKFINEAAELKSTKVIGIFYFLSSSIFLIVTYFVLLQNNVLIFEYKAGKMRHIVGIRENMLAIARQHCPQIKVRSSHFNCFSSSLICFSQFVYS